jgi:hypothetical protein
MKIQSGGNSDDGLKIGESDLARRAAALDCRRRNTARHAAGAVTA